MPQYNNNQKNFNLTNKLATKRVLHTVKSIFLLQHRFLLVQNSSSTAERQQEYMWWVPLSYTSGDQPDFSQTQPAVWMNDTEKEVTITSLPEKDTWVIFNLQEAGYYRVNYDDNNWQTLMFQLLNGHQVIHVINRAQIIDDALNLARAGKIILLKVQTSNSREFQK